MAISSRPPKNLWVAAGDGDLPRVQELIEQYGMSPNAPDPFTYTPMHAAASYGHVHVLQYLIDHGGDVNITDEDGDTPLYTVEDIDTARFLVEYGATVDRTNNEGTTPIQHLTEEYPEVSQYLQHFVSPEYPQNQPPVAPPSEYQQNAASEQMTDALMTSVQEIMQRAEVDGNDPDQELRQLVQRAVLEGVITGYEMLNTQASEDRESLKSHGSTDISPKRQRTDNDRPP